MESLKPLLTTEDVAAILNVEVVTVRRLAQRGELAAYRIGGEYRFSEQDIEQYLQQHYVPAKPIFIEWDGLRLKKPTRHHLEHFTKRARQAVAYASEEARAMKHSCIGCEHLLLGLVQEKEGLAASVLYEFGITLERAREVVQSVKSAGEGEAVDTLGVEPATKQAFERAAYESGQMQHSYVGTEHLLLALLQDAQLTGIWHKLGVTPEQICEKVMILLSKE